MTTEAPKDQLPSDEVLRDWIERRLSDGSSRVEGSRAYSSAVFRYDHGPVPLAIKTAVGGPWQRYLLRREARVYEALSGVKGFAHYFKFLDGKWLILEWAEGSLYRFADLGDRERFFTEFRRILDAMHERGVAHGDLKKKENLLVAPDGCPIVLDLGTAVIKRQGFGWLLFSSFKRFDNNAWIKHKYRGRFTAISDDDRRFFRPTLLERASRALRNLRGEPEYVPLHPPTISSDEPSEPGSVRREQSLRKRGYNSKQR